jgi:hypothetical protein
LVAAQATSPKKDRAVVTGARNFFRTIGGAFGLASTFFSNYQAYYSLWRDFE